MEALYRQSTNGAGFQSRGEAFDFCVLTVRDYFSAYTPSSFALHGLQVRVFD
jgi:hypothetical protein